MIDIAPNIAPPPSRTPEEKDRNLGLPPSGTFPGVASSAPGTFETKLGKPSLSDIAEDYPNPSKPLARRSSAMCLVGDIIGALALFVLLFCGLLLAGVMATTQPGMITFGYTAQLGAKIAGRIIDEDIGLEGGVRVRNGEKVKELVVAKDVGYFIQNAFA